MRTYLYTEYGVELLDGEIASASSRTECERYGPHARIIVARDVYVTGEAGSNWTYELGAWQPA